MRDRLAKGEEAAFQALYEERESSHDAQQADQHVGQVRKRLLQDDDLKERDDRDDRRQVAQRPDDPTAEQDQEIAHETVTRLGRPSSR